MTEPKTAKDALPKYRSERVEWDDGQIVYEIHGADTLIVFEGHNAKAQSELCLATMNRAQPEQAPADVKELIRKYQHEVDYLEQIERTEFGDDSLSTYSIFLKELKGLSSQPPAVAGDDLRVAELTSVLIDLNNTRHAQNAIYKFVPDTLDQLFNKYEGKYGMTYFAMTAPPQKPPAGEVPGLREEWQGIDTVQKAGKFDVWAKRWNVDKDAFEFMRFTDCYWRERDEFGQWKEGIKGVDPNWKPTHWRPLPKSPDDEAARQVAAGQGVRGDLPYSTELSDKRVEKFMEDYGAPNSTSLFCMLKQYENQIRHEITEALTSQAAESAVDLPVEEGDIIVFKAIAGHPVYGKEQEFIGRVEKDAKGLYAANYYQHAWKKMRIVERASKGLINAGGRE